MTEPAPTPAAPPAAPPTPANPKPSAAAPLTIRDRLLAAGLSPERADAHLAAGTVRVNGERVTGPEHPAPRPSSYVIGPAS